jgi:hypothetical protein
MLGVLLLCAVQQRLLAKAFAGLEKCIAEPLKRLLVEVSHFDFGGNCGELGIILSSADFFEEARELGVFFGHGGAVRAQGAFEIVSRWRVSCWRR